MGGSESVLKKHLQLYGFETIFNYVMLQRKLDWLKGDCMRQIKHKIDQEVKYILSQMDEHINQKKYNSIEQYKTMKSDIIRKEPQKVKNYEQRHGKSLQNIYGKNKFLDQLNLIKINFHIEVHVIKKRIKKEIQQKIASIESLLLYQSKIITIKKQILEQILEQIFKNPKFKNNFTQKLKQVQQILKKFKSNTIQQFDFNEIFWPHYEGKIRQIYLQIDKISTQVQSLTNTMKNDLIGIWNFFLCK